MSTALERGVDMLKSQVDARVESYFSSCTRCGVCAEACLFYTETGDPRYTPIYKTEPLRKVWQNEHTLWGKLSNSLGMSKSMTEKDLSDWEELVYDGCSMCSRCSMVCPVGIDIAYLIRKVKEGLAAAGFIPEGLQMASERALEFGSPMGLTAKSLRTATTALEKEYDIVIPIDVVGADYLCTLSSSEVVLYSEYIAAISKIFSAAGISWTLSSKYFEATNTGVQMGDTRLAAQLLERIVEVATELKIKTLISPECGHAYTTIRWDAPNILGRALPFKVVHIMELLEQLRTEGKLKTTCCFDEHLTYHDPCNISRRGGVLEQPRHLLNQVAPNFIEMHETKEMNWCCGGGGGVSSNERAEPLRLQVFNIKKRQIEDLKLSTLVTSCSNCRSMLEEGLEEYDMDVEVIGLTELIADHLSET
jgi:Fe-S oxidoreductase